MKWYDLQNKCNKVLVLLVNRGEEVCDKFEAKPESTYFCNKCGYSQYIHLCKEVVEADD